MFLLREGQSGRKLAGYFWARVRPKHDHRLASDPDSINTIASYVNKLINCFIADAACDPLLMMDQQCDEWCQLSVYQPKALSLRFRKYLSFKAVQPAAAV